MANSIPEGRQVNIKRKLAALVAGSTLALGAAVALSTQPAIAASGDPGWVNSGTAIHTCASQSCPVSSVTQYGAWIPFQCWVDTWAGYWQRWFKLNQLSLWIRADFVYYQPSLPQC